MPFQRTGRHAQSDRDHTVQQGSGTADAATIAAVAKAVIEAIYKEDGAEIRDGPSRQPLRVPASSRGGRGSGIRGGTRSNRDVRVRVPHVEPRAGTHTRGRPTGRLTAARRGPGPAGQVMSLLEVPPPGARVQLQARRRLAPREPTGASVADSHGGRNHVDPKPVPLLQQDAAETGHVFESTNPDFTKVVSTLNKGARLQNCLRNWEEIPPNILKAIDKVTTSIKPPLGDEALASQMSKLSTAFAKKLKALVDGHVISKYRLIKAQSADLDHSDHQAALDTAKRQLLKGNKRMHPELADHLLQVVKADMLIGPHKGPGRRHTKSKSGKVTTRGHAAANTAPPAEPVTPEAMDDVEPTENLIEELSEDELREVLEDTLSENSEREEVIVTPPPTHSSCDEGPLPKRTCSETDIGFRAPLPPAPKSKPTATGGGPSPPGPEVRRATSDSSGSMLSLAENVPPLTTTPSPPGPLVAEHPHRAPTETHAGRSVLTPPGAPATPPSLPASPASSADTGSRLPKKHALLTSYPPSNKSAWRLPDIAPEHNVLVLTASNGVWLAQFCPQNWHVVAFRGAKMHNLVKMLESCPLPTSVDTLVLFGGLNDRQGGGPPFINTATRLRELTDRQQRRVVVLPIPKMPNAPPHVLAATLRLNTVLREVLDGTHRFIEWPSHAAFGPARPDDFSHLNLLSLRYIATFICDILRDLN